MCKNYEKNEKLNGTEEYLDKLKSGLSLYEYIRYTVPALKFR